MRVGIGGRSGEGDRIEVKEGRFFLCYLFLGGL